MNSATFPLSMPAHMCACRRADIGAHGAQRPICMPRSEGQTRSIRGGLLALAHALIPILDVVETDTVALGQGDPRLVALSDHHHVVQARGEGVADGVLHVHDLEGTRVLL